MPKLSGLTAITQPDADALLLVVDNEESKKITLTDFYKTVSQMLVFTWCSYCDQKNLQEREHCWACGGRLERD